MKLLFVCVGNINRSAAAEIICKKLAPHHEVKSCALNEVSGRSITGKMRDVLTDMGYKVPPVQKSTAITKELIDWADEVIVMDRANLRRLYDFCNPGLLTTLLKTPVIGVKDPHFSKGIEDHIAAAKKIENYIKTNLCAE